jgi:CO/xanthine dehydrogenase FAD-binding subunit
MNEPRTCHPRSLAELDAIINDVEVPITFFAGATDLMVASQEWRSSTVLLDLLQVREMRRTIEIQENGLLIGAAVALSEIIAHPVIRERFPMLAEAISQIGSVQIRNRATLGGNIANASPAGDSLPLLIILQAQVLTGPARRGVLHKQPVADVMLGPGRNTLLENHYLAYIFLPFHAENGRFWNYRKVGQRRAMAISKLSLAVLGWQEQDRLQDVRICAGSVTPRVKRAARTEALLNGQKLNEELIKQARRALIDEVTPISDIRSTGDYRRRVCGELLAEALSALME